MVFKFRLWKWKHVNMKDLPWDPLTCSLTRLWISISTSWGSGPARSLPSSIRSSMFSASFVPFSFSNFSITSFAEFRFFGSCELFFFSAVWVAWSLLLDLVVVRLKLFDEFGQNNHIFNQDRLQIIIYESYLIKSIN